MEYLFFKRRLFQAIQAADSTTFFDLVSKHPHYAHEWKSLRTNNGDTIVHLAAQAGCVDIIEFYAVLKNRTIMSCKNKDDKTPLHVAVLSGHLDCVKFLLQVQVNVNALKRSDWTPLMLACTKPNLEIVKELLLYDADLNIVNKDGWTAFHIASREGNVDIVQHLLQFNSLVWNTKSKNGRTPLHTASLHGHLEVVKILLEHSDYGVDVKDSCGTTPLMDAASGNHHDVLKFLVQKGASVREEDKLGRNILHLAAEAGNLESIEYLVKKHKISIDSQTPQGLTPLHFACKENNNVTFSLLLLLGADWHLKDKKGRIAVEYATREDVCARMRSLLK